MPDIDPVTKLARRLGLDPTLLAAQAQSVGVVVVDVADPTAQTARYLAWERKLRDGTLSERKIIT
jgi:hypothetical protein